MTKPNGLKYKKNYSRERLQKLTYLMQSGSSRAVKDAIDVLAGGLWFEKLRNQLNQTTAYGLGKHVQPQTYRPRRDGRWPQHHNLWVKYARGLHLPGADTVLAANDAEPESGEILTSPVWKILDTSEPIGARGNELLRLLPLGVQEAIFKPGSLRYGRYVRRSAPNLPLKLLESHPDLDAVAGTVVLLREAYESQNRERAFQIGRSLHATLLMASACIPLSNIGPELIEFFIWQIFPMASDEEVAFDLDGSEFCMQGRCFIRAMLQLEDLGLIEALNYSSDWRKIVSLDFGFDLFYGLGPRLKLVKSPELSSADSRKSVGDNRAGRNWALPSLLSGRVQRLIPADIEAQMDSVR